jgi:hypothetical protein
MGCEAVVDYDDMENTAGGSKAVKNREPQPQTTVGTRLW